MPLCLQTKQGTRPQTFQFLKLDAFLTGRASEVVVVGNDPYLFCNGGGKQLFQSHARCRIPGNPPSLLQKISSDNNKSPVYLL
jgi:hypothetical protein